MTAMIATRWNEEDRWQGIGREQSKEGEESMLAVVAGRVVRDARVFHQAGDRKGLRWVQKQSHTAEHSRTVPGNTTLKPAAGVTS